MAEPSAFRGVIEFLGEIGVYDVILPFLLVFTIVFAILEKTKVLGTEKVGDELVTKKNLNAMASFVISFLVIASAKLVDIITAVSSQIVILLFLVVFFLLLIGSFYREGEDVFLEEGWRTMFMVIMFIGIVAIFLQAIKMDTGQGFLEWGWLWLMDHWTATGVASLILVLVVILFMVYIVREPKSKTTTSSTTAPQKMKEA
ncbi:hypothetical protein GF351_03780 [Candidatus Woesearchaeota archaeon]|nr:hypothetical protein [Candidatus Woesearchaeota archaeon]